MLSDEKRAALIQMCRDAGVMVQLDSKFGRSEYTSVQSSWPALEKLASAVAEAALKADRQERATVEDSVLAGKILNRLGYAVAPSLEFGVDPQRDSVVEVLASAPQQEGQDEPVSVDAIYGQKYYAGSRGRGVLTYKNQPFDNVIAWKLGAASSETKSGGDFIDGGLSLLQQLEARGFGVVMIAASPEIKND